MYKLYRRWSLDSLEIRQCKAGRIISKTERMVVSENAIAKNCDSICIHTSH